jgi:hypothetical protein
MVQTPGWEAQLVVDFSAQQGFSLKWHPYQRSFEIGGTFTALRSMRYCGWQAADTSFPMIDL